MNGKIQRVIPGGKATPPTKGPSKKTGILLIIVLVVIIAGAVIYYIYQLEPQEEPAGNTVLLSLKDAADIYMNQNNSYLELCRAESIVSIKGLFCNDTADAWAACYQSSCIDSSGSIKEVDNCDQSWAHTSCP